MRLVYRERAGRPDSPVIPGSRALQVFLALRVLQARLGHLDKVATAGFLVSLVLQAPQGPPAHPEHRAYRVTPASRDSPEHRDSAEHQEHRGPRERVDKVDIQDYPVSVVFLERWDFRARLVIQDLVGSAVRQGNQVFLVRVEHLGPAASRVIRDSVASQGHPELQEPRVRVELRALPDSPATADLADSQERLERLAPPVLQERPVSVDTQAFRDSLGLQGSPDSQVRPERVARPGLLGSQDIADSLASLDSLEPKGPPEHRDSREPAD